MKTSIKLNVSAEYIFERLIDSRIYDIFEATGEWVTEDDLTNFSYVSEDDAGQNCRIVLNKVSFAQSYHYQIETKNELISKACDLKTLAADKVEVTFSQRVKAKSLLHGLRNKITNLFLGWLQASNFRKVLKQIEVGY